MLLLQMQWSGSTGWLSNQKDSNTVTFKWNMFLFFFSSTLLTTQIKWQKTVLWATILHLCGIYFVTLHSCAVLTFIQELCQFYFSKDSKYSCCISTAMKVCNESGWYYTVCVSRLKHWGLKFVSWLWILAHHKVVLWLSTQSYWYLDTFHLSTKVIPKEHLHLKTCSPWVSPAVMAKMQNSKDWFRLHVAWLSLYQELKWLSMSAKHLGLVWCIKDLGPNGI